ncbi:acyltransferase family protein [Fodinicola acaciae]|uniref:acyltransferase family protein n=1 Tax=Fodinicola acaciae TaxID=2681555 RepID=UPI0013D45513|nr:acyltransferase [Fodinicola acaciae]
MVHAVQLPPPVAEKPRTRLFFLDRIKVALTALVVVHHAAVTYGHIPAWYYYEKPVHVEAGLLDLLALLNQSFFMGMFFLISAFFVPASYDRKGAKAFVRDRLLRLGVPLVVFYFVINPITGMAGALAQNPHVFGDAPWWLIYRDTIGAGPLWFAEALIAFVLGYVMWRKVAKKSAAPVAAVPRPFSYRGIGVFVVAVSVITFAWRLFVPQGMYVPIIGFPSAAFLPQYVGLFVLGLIAYQRGWLTTARRGLGWVGLAAVLVGGIVDVALTVTGGSVGLTATALVAAFAETVYCIGMCLALLSLFRHFSRREGAFGRYLSRHAFTVYIIHSPILVGVSIVLHLVVPTAPELVKFALAAGIAVPLSFALAYPVRLVPGARRIL